MAASSPIGQRLKAALVLADMTAARLAAEVEADINIGLRTIERVMQGHRELRQWELERIARALDVPTWFLERGVGGYADPATREEAAARAQDAAEAAERAQAAAGRPAAQETRRRT